MIFNFCVCNFANENPNLCSIPFQKLLFFQKPLKLLIRNFEVWKRIYRYQKSPNYKAWDRKNSKLRTILCRVMQFCITPPLNRVKRWFIFGFDRGLTAEEIIGATETNGQVYFLIKWAGTTDSELVPSKIANLQK